LALGFKGTTKEHFFATIRHYKALIGMQGCERRVGAAAAATAAASATAAACLCCK
jgi:hypothetical protein